jgi:serine/threonine protein kinase
VVREGKLSLNIISKISIQLLQTLKILHFRNIAHNDIKPGNILFGLKDKRSQLYIVDFGLADITN